MERMKYNEFIMKFGYEEVMKIEEIVENDLFTYNSECLNEEMEDCLIEKEDLIVEEMVVLGHYSIEYFVIKYIDADDKVLCIISKNIFNNEITQIL